MWGDPAACSLGSAESSLALLLSLALDAAEGTQWSSTVPLWLAFTQYLKLPRSFGALNKPLNPYPSAPLPYLENGNYRRYLTGRK